MGGWAVGAGLGLAGLLAWSAAGARRDPRATRGALLALRGIGAGGLAAMAIMAALLGAWPAAGLAAAAAGGLAAARMPARVRRPLRRPRPEADPPPAGRAMPSSG